MLRKEQICGQSYIFFCDKKFTIQRTCFKCHMTWEEQWVKGQKPKSKPIVADRDSSLCTRSNVTTVGSKNCILMRLFEGSSYHNESNSSPESCNLIIIFWAIVNCWLKLIWIFLFLFLITCTWENHKNFRLNKNNMPSKAHQVGLNQNLETLISPPS